MAGSITRYVYDGEDLLLEYDGTNTFVARYSHGDQVDQPLVLQKAGVGFFYYHRNHHGSITHLTNSAGAVVNRYTYDAYGRRLSVTEAVGQPYSYTGREYDAESGVYYYRARSYDPTTGRFLSEDPIGFEAGDQNLYRYVFNNPINFSDSSGKFAFILAPLAGGRAAGAALEAAAITAAVAATAALAERINNALQSSSAGSGQGKGERGQTGTESGTGNPFKHTKPHPTDPSKVLVKNPHTGKTQVKAKPKGFDKHWEDKQKKKGKKQCE